jgi:nitrite reductase/ring-hydroxylating ferredoxin subunit
MSEQQRADRLERVVARLLRGKRIPARKLNREDAAAVMTAARLAAARESYPRPSAGFRRRMAAHLEAAPEQGLLTRRSALVAGLGIAAGSVAGFEVERLLGRLQPPPVAQTAVQPKPGRWVAVAALHELPEGEGVRVEAGAVPAYLFRSGDRVSAVSAICSHLPCSLRWKSDTGVLLCPCHNAAFTRDGAPTSQAYPLPNLPTVQVRVVDGRVEVLGA